MAGQRDGSTERGSSFRARAIDAVTLAARRIARLSLATKCVIFVATANAVLLARWPFIPGQDFGYHAYATAIAHDHLFGGGYLATIFRPIDPLASSTFLYYVAGAFGHVIGARRAILAVVVLYVLFLPLSGAYALALMRRSTWPALLLAAQAYTSTFRMGYLFFVLAFIPMMIALPAFWLGVRRPSRPRAIKCALVLTLLFLCHAQLFLWTGVMLAAMSVWVIATRLRARRLNAAWRASMFSIAVVAPSLLLLVRFQLALRAAAKAEGVPAPDFSDDLHNTITDRLRGLFVYLEPLKTSHDHVYALLLCFLVFACVMLASRQRARGAPILELAFLATLASYFVLPEVNHGQQIASRQIDPAGVLLVAFIRPPTGLRLAWARRAMVGLVAGLALFRLYDWHHAIAEFNRRELAGLTDVVRTCPHGEALDYSSPSQPSAYVDAPNLFAGASYYVAADCDLFVPLVTGVAAAIRFKGKDASRPPPIPATVHLVRKTNADARPDHAGTLIVRAGVWELWRTPR